MNLDRESAPSSPGSSTGADEMVIGSAINRAQYTRPLRDRTDFPPSERDRVPLLYEQWGARENFLAPRFVLREPPERAGSESPSCPQEGFGEVCSSWPRKNPPQSP